MSRTARRRTLGRTVGAAALSTALALTAASVHAEPRPTLDQVKARVAELHEQAEAVAEEYNAGRIEHRAAQERLRLTTESLNEAKQRVANQRELVGRFAAEAYRNGSVGQSSLAVLLVEDDLTTAMQKLSTMGILERQQSAALARIESANQRLAQAEAEASQVAEEADRLNQQLAERKGQVESLLADASALLDQLTAEEKERLAAEQAAAARAAEAEAEAARAAAAAREAEAARATRSEPAASSAGGGGNGEKPGSGGANRAQRAVDAALSKLGRPYVWAAAGPDSFDCSGLIQWAYKQVGVYVPHYTGAIWTGFPRVDRSQLRPGDIVFFYPDVHHAGIYIGGGKMVHAPQTGDVVKISDAFWGRDYTGAVRITG